MDALMCSENKHCMHGIGKKVWQTNGIQNLSCKAWAAFSSWAAKDHLSTDIRIRRRRCRRRFQQRRDAWAAKTHRSNFFVQNGRKIDNVVLYSDLKNFVCCCLSPNQRNKKSRYWLLLLLTFFYIVCSRVGPIERISDTQLDFLKCVSCSKTQTAIHGC